MWAELWEAEAAEAQDRLEKGYEEYLVEGALSAELDRLLEDTSRRGSLDLRLSVATTSTTASRTSSTTSLGCRRNWKWVVALPVVRRQGVGQLRSSSLGPRFRPLPLPLDYTIKRIMRFLDLAAVTLWSALERFESEAEYCAAEFLGRQPVQVWFVGATGV